MQLSVSVSHRPQAPIEFVFAGDRGPMTSQLFSPVSIGGVSLPNRIAVSPMCQYSAVEGSASDWHLQHLGSLSLSGAGLVILEATAVEAAGRITPACLGL